MTMSNFTGYAPTSQPISTLNLARFGRRLQIWFNRMGKSLQIARHQRQFGFSVHHREELRRRRELCRIWRQLRAAS